MNDAYAFFGNLDSLVLACLARMPIKRLITDAATTTELSLSVFLYCSAFTVIVPLLSLVGL